MNQHEFDKRMTQWKAAIHYVQHEIDQGNISKAVKVWRDEIGPRTCVVWEYGFRPLALRQGWIKE